MKHLAQSSICLLSLLMLWQISSAQESAKIIWEHKYGYVFRNEVAHGLLQNMAGGVTFVGEWSPYGRKTGSDIYLVILDDKGKTLVEKQTFLGRQGDDGAFAMVQTPDGGYALAGYTESSKAPGYQGKRDAWLVKTNEHGEALWEKVVGTPQNDEFKSIAQDDQGNLYLTGKKQDEMWLYKTDWLGRELLNITFDNKTGKTQGNAIALSPSGKIAITGTRMSDQGTYQAVKYLDDKGKIIWQNEYKQSTGEGIIIDSNDDVVTVGVFDDPREREQILVKKTNSSGKELWSRSNLGGGAEDHGATILQDFDGNYWVGGYTYSHERGARRKQLWLHQLTSEGKDAWKEAKYFGDKQDDGAEDLMQADDGNLFIAGFSSSDAWVFELERNKPEGFSNRGSVRFGDAKLVDENGNGIIEAGERGWVEFDVTNTGSNALWQLSAQVASTGNAVEDFSFFEKVSIGNLPPGASRRVFVPVSGSEGLDAGTVQLSVRISPASITTTEPLAISIPCLKAVLPELAIVKSSFTANGKPISQAGLGETVNLELEITNKGAKAAEDVQLIFSYPASVLPVGERLLKTGNLLPGASIRQQFSFKAEEIYQQNNIGIICQVREKSNLQSARDTFNLPVIERTQPQKAEPQKELMRISWLYPEPDASGKPGATVVSEDSVYQIKVLALASSQLEAKDFTLLLNGKPYDEGSKMREKGLQKNVDEYRFQTKVVFPAPGNYKIEIEAGNAASGKVKSAPIQVSYQPVKPNLHLISIGVPHDDLQYPTQDAADFAKAMRQQEGKLYGKVFEKLYNTKETTTQRSLELVVDQLQLDYTKRDLIKDKDVIIIFVSSHGINLPKEGFCLLPSDYDMLFAGKTSVNYKTSFLDPLADIHCKKYVFIDACNSGAIEEEEGGKGQTYDAVPDALIDVMKARGLRSLVSCQKDERSYEDPSWQNGAFTEAILEALSNKEGKVEKGTLKANKNGDKVLTFGELYEYLGKRVPYMVKTTKNGKGQNPFMPETSKEMADVPFYYFGD